MIPYWYRPFVVALLFIDLLVTAKLGSESPSSKNLSHYKGPSTNPSHSKSPSPTNLSQSKSPPPMIIPFPPFPPPGFFSHSKNLSILSPNQIGYFAPYTAYAVIALSPPSEIINWSCGFCKEYLNGFKVFKVIAAGGNDDSIQYCERDNRIP
jgi:hypothetical protein